MKIWVVTYFAYDDRWVEGAFTTREGAEEFTKGQWEYEIEEVTLEDSN